MYVNRFASVGSELLSLSEPRPFLRPAPHTVGLCGRGRVRGPPGTVLSPFEGSSRS